MSNEFKNILIGMDSSKSAVQALKTGLKIAKKYKSKLIIAHVVPIFGVYSSDNLKPSDTKVKKINNIKTSALSLSKKEKHKIQIIDLFGLPGEQLIKYALKNKIDLIILGKHGEGKEKTKHLLLGSVSKHVIDKSKSDVLIVK